MGLQKKEKSTVINYSLFVTLSSTILTAVAPLVAVFVDGLFTGNLLNAEAFNAINLVLPVSNIMMVITLICNMGGSLLAAKALAVDNYSQANKYFTLSLYSACLLAWTCTAAMFFNIDAVAANLCPSASGVQYVKDYLLVLLIYFVFLPFSTTFNNMVQMEGYPQLTSRIVIISNVVNIIGDVVFMYFLDMGLKGAALATAVSGILNTVLYLPHFLKGSSKYRLVRLTVQDLSLLRGSIVNGLGFNVFYIMTNTFAFLVNALLVHSLGNEAVSIFGVCLQIQSVTFAVVVGLCIGGIAQVNMLSGEGDNIGMRYVIGRILRIDAAFYALALIIMALFPQTMAGVFGIDSPAILNQCQIPFICFFSFYLCYTIICVHTTVSYQMMGHVGAKAFFVFLSGGLSYLLMLAFSQVRPEMAWIGLPVGGILSIIATFSFGFYHHLHDKGLTMFSMINKIQNDVRMEYAVDYDCKNLDELKRVSNMFENMCNLTKRTQYKIQICCLEFLDIMKKKKQPSYAKYFVISYREHDNKFIVSIKSPGEPCTLKLSEGAVDNNKKKIGELTQEEISSLILNVAPDEFSYKYNFGLNISTMTWINGTEEQRP